MKRVLKTLSLLFLALLLTAGLLCACDTKTPGGDETSTPETDPVPVKEEVHIDASSLSDYVLVVPKYASDELKKAVAALKSALDAHYGLHLSMSDDEYRFFAKAQTVKPCEILIGSTNREETIAFQKNLRYDAYGWELIGKKLVICGGTEELSIQALKAFEEQLNEKRTADVFFSNQNDTLLPGDGKWEQASYTVAGLPLTDYRIVLGNSDNLMMATKFRDKIGEMTGICVPIVEAGTLDKDNPVPSFLLETPEKVDKSLADKTEYGFSEYGYEVKTLKDVPQIVFGGETKAASLYAEDRFLTDLFNQKTIGTEPVKAVFAETVTIETKKEIPVDGVKLAGGDLSEYRIVYAEDAIGKAKFAAMELSAYLAKATGITVPVVTDDTQDGEDREIVVGITNRDTEAVKSRRAALINDGIMYFMEGNRLYIGSHTDAGQTYAVYHFLEEKIGCRFYAIDFETIHNAGVITIPSDLDESFSSPNYYRLTSLNGGSAERRKYALNAGEDIMYAIVGNAHTLGELSETGDGGTPNPCLCDEAIYQTVLKNVRARIEENPGCRIIAVTQNDTFAHCQCEKCLAVEKAENPSGLMLTFVNRLAEEIEKDYPEVELLTFAYTYTRTPPKTVKARDNVVIRLCSIECCFNHTLEDPTCESNKEFAADIAAWKDYCKKFYIWDYTIDWGSFSLPFPNFAVLRENARFFAESGSEGLYEQGVRYSETGEFSRLREYLLSKVIWNPYMTEEEYNTLMNEFLADYYGAGWQYIRYFIDGTCYGMADDLGIMDMLTQKSFVVSTEWMHECFDRAMDAAQDEETRYNCEKSSYQIECLKMYRDYLDQIHDVKHERYYVPAELLEKLKNAGVPMISPNHYIDEAVPIEE